MWNKIVVICTIVIATLLAVLALVLKPNQINFVVVISHFFEIMLPILAVGALLRYLTSPCENVWHIILPASTVFLAIVLAIFAVTLPPKNIDFVILISRFFEIMLPILAVGALLKYLTVCKKEFDQPKG